MKLNILFILYWSISSAEFISILTNLKEERKGGSSSSGASCCLHFATALFISTRYFLVFSSPQQISIALFSAHVVNCSWSPWNCRARLEEERKTTKRIFIFTNSWADYRCSLCQNCLICSNAGAGPALADTSHMEQLKCNSRAGICTEKAYHFCTGI